MGIITYLFHRSDSISDQKYNSFFLDIGENIHIHYRDLRIEFSVEEFDEFSRNFEIYLSEVRKEIASGYRDGVLPNTNEPHTVKTFWDRKKLSFPVKYNNNYLSIEENVDGYHIHIRNYKLLLDKESFKVFAKAMAKALMLLDDHDSADPLSILQANHLFPEVKSCYYSGTEQKIDLVVQPQYKKKTYQVLAGLGFKKNPSNDAHDLFFLDGTLISINKKDCDNSCMVSNSKDENCLISLLEFIDNGMQLLSPDDLNNLKLKLLHLFKLSESGRQAEFSLDDIYLTSRSLVPYIDYFSKPRSAKPPAQEEYQRLSRLLELRKIFFVKPGKKKFFEQYQTNLLNKFHIFIKENISHHVCVNRIYLLGSITKMQAGRYNVPFVHFDWAKLASDFDILIELDPEHEKEIPKNWEKKFLTKFNSCHYCHLGDIGNGMESNYAKLFPDIKFYEHMLEAYLYFPSVGDRAIKDTYLRNIGCKVIFERKGILDWIEEEYKIFINNINIFPAASFNRVFDIKAVTGRYALKLYNHRYINNDSKDKLSYEVFILLSLNKAGLNVSSPVQNKQGKLVSIFKEDQVILFDFVSGIYKHRPNESDCYLAGSLIAKIHLVTQKLNPPIDNRYDIRDYVCFWLEVCQDYLEKNLIDLPIKPCVYASYISSFNEDQLHCHGDVSPRNFLFDGDTCGLVDFQNLGYGPSIIDVSDGIVEFSLHDSVFCKPNFFSFLKGYSEFRLIDKSLYKDLKKNCIAQSLVKMARLLRAHLEFGQSLKSEQINGLKSALNFFIDWNPPV